MKIKDELLKEHSLKQCQRIVKYIGNDKDRFRELMNCFFEGEYRVTQRAGWPMSYCAEQYPQLMKPYFTKLVSFLKNDKVHPSVRRNIIRMFQTVDIPEKFQGEIMDLCFQYVASHTEPPAVKAFSLTVLENLGKLYPEILPELKTVIEERWPHETAAFRSRARKILKIISSKN